MSALVGDPDLYPQVFKSQNVILRSVWYLFALMCVSCLVRLVQGMCVVEGGGWLAKHNKGCGFGVVAGLAHECWGLGELGGCCSDVSGLAQAQSPGLGLALVGLGF